MEPQIDLDLSARGIAAKHLTVDLGRIPPAFPKPYKDAAKQLKSLIASPRAIILLGPERRGKTSLAAGMMRAFYEAGFRRIHLATAAELQTQLRNERSDPINGLTGSKYHGASLLVIDDLECRDPDPDSENLIWHPINYRRANHMATVVISTPAGLSDLSRPLADPRGSGIRRSLQEPTIINCDWPEIDPAWIGSHLDAVSE